MTDREILQKAIDKAYKNGYVLCNGFNTSNYKICFTYQGVHCYNKEKEFFEHHETVFDIIFSHDFAKAFFGTEEVMKDFGWGNVIENEYWKICLMEMAVEKEPLKYLAKFLSED